MIAQRLWYLQYDILKNKKLDVKKVIPKISEGFTIVITRPLQMLGLKGSRDVPEPIKVADLQKLANQLMLNGALVIDTPVKARKTLIKLEKRLIKLETL